MSSAVLSNKIGVHHLERRAVVYLRQSSERQVRENVESQRLQYGLSDRARELGWQQVEVVDSDLGASAAMGAAQRVGFEQVIAAVAMSEIGIVFSREASRLSRTDRDWCRLLEVCQVFDTLIGDHERVYDLNSMDDQLVLGIKATMSVVELKVLQMRMREGSEAKARRGELERLLPPGFVRDTDGHVVKDPDARVREATALVFGKFRELWSVRQTFLWFHNERIELPVNKKRNGRMQIIWQLPTLSFIGSVLRNPFYAGAFAWGQRQTRAVLEPTTGRVRKRMTALLPPEQCRVFIPDHHEGYIDWETFEENQRLMRANGLKTNTDESVAAVRGGQGLLVGILRCGRCGRKMHIRYWGRSGTSGRYLCKGDFESGGRYCLGMGGATVDHRFSEEILSVVSPLGVRASLEAMKRLQVRDEQRRKAVEKQLEQVEYEAMRAFEQYDQVDARNRLVASELEKRWNAKLQDVERLKAVVAEIEAETRSLTSRQRQELMALGENFSGIWENENCPVELKKKIIRTVVEEAIVNLDDDEQTLRFIVHWKGGVHTRFTMAKPVSPRGRKTAAEDIDIIRNMAVRYGDGEIARVLNKLGRQTGMEKRWSAQRVARVRHQHSIRGQSNTRPAPGILNQHEAAAHTGVSSKTIRRLVEEGILQKSQIVPWAPWEIKQTDLDAEPVCGILQRLRDTGKLVLRAAGADDDQGLLPGIDETEGGLAGTAAKDDQALSSSRARPTVAPPIPADPESSP